MAELAVADSQLPGQRDVSTSSLKALPIVCPVTPEGDENSALETDLRGLEALVKMIQAEAGEAEVEVAVVAVMGKLRGGKSFLLNLLVHYFLWLEKNQERLRAAPRQRNRDFKFSQYGTCQSQDWLPEWLPEVVDTPFQVDALSDTQTCTRGLWILNRPFFLRKPRSQDRIALLLLDSQGTDDGLLDEAQSRAIFGITTVLASTVIYNVRSPLDVKHVKDLGDLANIFQVALADLLEDGKQDFIGTETCVFGRLLLLLRDAKFEPGASISQCCCKLLRETANKLDPTHAKINRERIEELRKSFEQPMGPPFGLPHPGAAADFAQSRTTTNMRQLNDSFKVLLDEFVRSNFEDDFPAPVRRCLTGKTLTARSLTSYLERIRDAFAACMVAGGDPELVSMHREEVAEQAFVNEVCLLKPEEQENFPAAAVEKTKHDALRRFEKVLGYGLSWEARMRWIRRLEEFMDGHIAQIQNKYVNKQGHGDRAVAATAVVAVSAVATPLGGWMLAHWSALFGTCLAGLGFGYWRHARDHSRDPGRSETVRSFLKASWDRCHDMAFTARRLGAKASRCR